MKALHAFHPQIQEDEIVVEVAPSSCLVYVRDIFQEVVAVKEALSHHVLQMPIDLMSAFGYLSGKVECPHFNLDSKANIKWGHQNQRFFTVVHILIQWNPHLMLLV